MKKLIIFLSFLFFFSPARAEIYKLEIDSLLMLMRSNEHKNHLKVSSFNNYDTIVLDKCNAIVIRFSNLKKDFFKVDICKNNISHTNPFYK